MPPDRASEPPTEPQATPMLRIVWGEPTADELAALVVAVASLASLATPAPPVARSQWRNRARNIRPAIGPSAGSWRASGLPR